jgi:phosphatidylglycerol:prolipoprotein diacylglycerol transferase
MHPILFRLGSLTIYTYGPLLAAGLAFGWGYNALRAARSGLDPHKIWAMGVYATLAGLLASKVWLWLSDYRYYAIHLREILRMVASPTTGTFYGGLAGAFLMIWLYTRSHNMPFLWVMDSCAAGLALGHAIGRLGCFFAGCCYGKPTSLPWGVTFTSEVAARISQTPLHTPLHPTQLYEAGAEFLNFILLASLGRRPGFAGQRTGAYFVLYGLERGVIEFFRGDAGRTMMYHDSVSLMQVVSVGMVLTGVLLWSRGMRGATPIPPPLPSHSAA